MISACFIVGSAAWYLLYASRRVSRASAVMHVVERVTDHELGKVTLENEQIGGNREEFDQRPIPEKIDGDSNEGLFVRYKKRKE